MSILILDCSLSLSLHFYIDYGTEKTHNPIRIVVVQNKPLTKVFLFVVLHDGMEVELELSQSSIFLKRGFPVTAQCVLGVRDHTADVTCLVNTFVNAFIYHILLPGRHVLLKHTIHLPAM